MSRRAPERFYVPEVGDSIEPRRGPPVREREREVDLEWTRKRPDDRLDDAIRRGHLDLDRPRSDPFDPPLDPYTATPLVLRKKEIESIVRPIRRSPSPDPRRHSPISRRRSSSPHHRSRSPSRERVRFIERPKRSPSPPSPPRERERIRMSFTDSDPQRRADDHTSRRGRSRSPSFERRRHDSPTSPAPPSFERLHISERSRPHSPPQPVPEVPQPPPVLLAPPIHQDVITHHHHVDHGYDYPAPRARSPPPTLPHPGLVPVRRIPQEETDIEIDIRSRRDRPRSRSSSPFTSHIRLRAPSRPDIDDAPRVKADTTGATTHWSVLDVPPGTEKVRIDGKDGAVVEVSWGKKDEENGMVKPNGPGHVGPPEQAAFRTGLWTEITKDLVVYEALEEWGLEFYETKGSFWVVASLGFPVVQELVRRSDAIRAMRRARIREIEIERRREREWGGGGDSGRGLTIDEDGDGRGRDGADEWHERDVEREREVIVLQGRGRGGSTSSTTDPEALHTIRTTITASATDTAPNRTRSWHAPSGTPPRSPKADPAVWPSDIVTWDGPDDAANPLNWSKRRRIAVTMQLGFTSLGAAFASSSFSPTFEAVGTEFGIGRQVTVLSLSLYVLGFAFGPLLWAPISELYGRKISILPAYFVFGIFLVAVGTAQNIQTVMICRYFAGLMASAPISNVAGALADMWDDHDRALAAVGYSISVIGGPTIGPLVGAAITNSYLGWRWTEYITAIMIFTIFILDVFFLPETYAPVLLQRKARRLRYQTGNWALHSIADEEDLTIHTILEKHLARPLTMLATEPIILSLAIYNSFVYGLLYLLFEAFPLEYQTARGWTAVQGSLVFLAVLIGVVISGYIQAAYQPYFWRRLAAAHRAGQKNIPEARLPPMMLGAVLFAAGLFWFGGGSSVDKPPVIGILAAGCIGSGFILIFQNAVNYFIDAFTLHAASAQASNTFLRSLAGAAFPLFAYPMFWKLGIDWASYLLGFIATALIPLPVLFYVLARS